MLLQLSVKPRGGWKVMVTPAGGALECRQDSTLIKAVALPFRWRRMLESRCFGTINEPPVAQEINSSYASRVLRLTLLAPDIVEAILGGRQAEGGDAAGPDGDTSGRLGRAARTESRE